MQRAARIQTLRQPWRLTANFIKRQKARVRVFDAPDLLHLVVVKHANLVPTRKVRCANDTI